MLRAAAAGAAGRRALAALSCWAAGWWRETAPFPHTVTLTGDVGLFVQSQLSLTWCPNPDMGDQSPLLLGHTALAFEYDTDSAVSPVSRLRACVLWWLLAARGSAASADVVSQTGCRVGCSGSLVGRR